MNHNFNDKLDLVEAYLDGRLDDDQKNVAEKILQENPDLREEYEYMKLAVSSVQLSALHSQVGKVAKNHFSTISETATIKPIAKVYNLRFYALRVAAILLIVCISYTGMLYITTSPGKLFAEGFTDYDLPVSRGASTSTTIEQFYKLQNWQKVINTVAVENSTAQKDLFLAGISCLKINQAAPAASFFKKILVVNQTAINKYYQEESEFYLALAYLKLSNTKKAGTLLQSIQSNPAHPYYKDAKKISPFKMKMLEWKQ
jgi:hypothetical protein